MSWIILLLVSVLTLWIVIKWLKDRNSVPLPPGPSFLESMWIMIGFIMKDDVVIVGDKLAKRHGEIFNISFLGNNMVFLNSTRLIRNLLVTSKYRDFTNDRPPSFIRDDIVDGGKDIAFSDYNTQQVKLRKLVHGVVRLYGEGIREFEDLVNTELHILEDEMKKAIGEKSFDMDTALTESIIRILHVFLTNQRSEEHADVKSIVEDFSNSITAVSKVDMNLILSLFPWLQHLPGPPGRLAQEARVNFERICTYFLNPSKKESIKGNGSLIGTLYAEQDRDPQLTDVHVRGILMDLVVGGFATTKGALSGFFLLMMRYPDIQRKIQEELDAKLKGRRPSLADKGELHYTNAAILECLRYIRHIPLGIPHHVNADIEVEGYRIPANSTLITNYWVNSRDAEFWKMPNVMNPERYLDDDKTLLPSDHPMRQHFMPFGIGRRNCIGESFAKSRIFLYVTTLLQKFELQKGDNELPSEDSSTWHPSAALHPSFLNCKIVERK